jgi:hypothetical protein
MIAFLIDIDKNTLKIHNKKINFDFPIYQIFFDGSMFCILFYPGSDNKKWGQFLNLWGVSTEGEVIWKADLPDNTPGCFDRINLLEGKLHAYASTFDCILDPTTGKIISSEFYK